MSLSDHFYTSTMLLANGYRSDLYRWDFI